MKNLGTMIVAVAVSFFAPYIVAQDSGFVTEKGAIIDGLLSEPADNTLDKSLNLEDGAEPKTIRVEQISDDGGTVGSRGFGIVRTDRPRVDMQIQFDFDSYRIRSESYRVLDNLADALEDDRLSDYQVAVNGHTDSSGSRDYNLTLSYNRARAVKDYLVDHRGVSPSRLKVRGYGEELPRVSNSSEHNRQLNRRVEIERLR